MLFKSREMVHEVTPLSGKKHPGLPRLAITLWAVTEDKEDERSTVTTSESQESHNSN